MLWSAHNEIHRLLPDGGALVIIIMVDWSVTINRQMSKESYLTELARVANS